MFNYLFGIGSGMLLYHFFPQIKEGLILMMKKAAREVIKEDAKEEERKERVAKDEASGE